MGSRWSWWVLVDLGGLVVVLGFDHGDAVWVCLDLLWGGFVVGFIYLLFIPNTYGLRLELVPLCGLVW